MLNHHRVVLMRPHSRGELDFAIRVKPWLFASTTLRSHQVNDFRDQAIGAFMFAVESREV